MFETELRAKLPCKQPSLYLRYIDDIIMQWGHSLAEFQTFLNSLNNIDPHIKLKHEWEEADPEKPNTAIMPFLDLNIHRAPSGFSFCLP